MRQPRLFLGSRPSRRCPLTSPPTVRNGQEQRRCLRSRRRNSGFEVAQRLRCIPLCFSSASAMSAATSASSGARARSSIRLLRAASTLSLASLHRPISLIRSGSCRHLLRNVPDGDRYPVLNIALGTHPVAAPVHALLTAPGILVFSGVIRPPLPDPPAPGTSPHDASMTHPRCRRNGRSPSRS